MITKGKIMWKIQITPIIINKAIIIIRGNKRSITTTKTIITMSIIIMLTILTMSTIMLITITIMSLTKTYSLNRQNHTI